jgi:hypothetical protein
MRSFEVRFDGINNWSHNNCIPQGDADAGIGKCPQLPVPKTVTKSSMGMRSTVSRIVAAACMRTEMGAGGTPPPFR